MGVPTVTATYYNFDLDEQGSVSLGVGSRAEALQRASIQIGNRVYALRGDDLHVINVTDPTSPSIVGVVSDVTGVVSNGAIDGLVTDSTGQYLYVPNGTTSLYTLDVTADVDDPTLVDTLAIPAGGLEQVVLRVGSNLFILHESAAQISKIDISTPNNPGVPTNVTATNTAKSCLRGAVTPDSNFLMFPSEDGSGTIGVIGTLGGTPTEETAFTLPSISSQQSKPAGALLFDTTDLLYVVCVVDDADNTSIQDYFWLVLQEGVDWEAMTVVSDASGFSDPSLPICRSPQNAIGLDIKSDNLRVSTYNDSDLLPASLLTYNRGATWTTPANMPRLANGQTFETMSIVDDLQVGASAAHATGLTLGSTSRTLIALAIPSSISLDTYMMQGGLSWTQGVSNHGPKDRVASTGTLSFTLDNSEFNADGTVGLFSPDHSSLKQGFRVGGFVDVDLDFGTDSLRFRGVVDKIEPEAGRNLSRRARVSCVDTMERLARTKTDKLTGTTDASIQDIFNDLLANVPTLPDTTGKLASISIDSAAEDIYDFAFDRAYDEKTAIVGEIQKICNSSRGFFVVSSTGQLVFLGRDTIIDDAVFEPVLNDDVINGLLLDHSFGEIYNKIQVKVYPRLVDSAATTVLFTLENKVRIEVGETIVFDAPYRDPSGKASRIGGVDMVAPVAATDYSFRPRRGVAGTNLDGNLDISVKFGAASANVSIGNAGTTSKVPGWLTTFQLRGKGVYSQEPITIAREDIASQARHGLKELIYDMPYETSPEVGGVIADAFLDLYSTPRSYVRQVTIPLADNASADSILARLNAGTAGAIGVKFAVAETVTGLPDTGSTSWVLGDSGRTELDDTTMLTDMRIYVVTRIGVSMAPGLSVTVVLGLIPEEQVF